MANTRVFVARLAGCNVFDPAGDRVGKVRDVLVVYRKDDPPRVVGLIVDRVQAGAGVGAVDRLGLLVVLAAVALVAMLAIAPFFLASGLMAPGWAVALFILIWCTLFVAGCWWIRRKPLWVVPLPFLLAAIWLGGPLSGAFKTEGTIAVTGTNVVGVRTGDITGNVRLAGTVALPLP